LTGRPNASSGTHSLAWSVDIRGGHYDPAIVRVSAGGTATWRNLDPVDRTVVGPGFRSPAIAPGRTWTRRFTNEGTYAYGSVGDGALLGTLLVGRQ
jgi:plastocyanin